MCFNKYKAAIINHSQQSLKDDLFIFLPTKAVVKNPETERNRKSFHILSLQVSV